jgi:hypothetical protein
MSYKINISTTTKGMAFSLDVKETDTIKIVKDMIHESEGVFPEHQKLFYLGKILDNNKTLRDYKITLESTLLLTLTLKKQDS